MQILTKRPSMKKTDIAYIAGLFDGEGCVDFNVRRSGRVGFFPVVAICNTVKEALEFVQKRYGGKISRRERKKYKAIYVWQLNTLQDCEFFLRSIKEFSIIKSGEISIALDVIKKLKQGLHKTTEGCISILEEIKKLKTAHVHLRRESIRKIERLIDALRSGEKLPCSRTWFTEEEKRIIVENARRLTSVEIAKLVGRTPSAIRAFMRRNKIRGFKRGETNMFTKIERMRKIARNVFEKDNLDIGELNAFIKRKLEEMYVHEGKSGTEIARIFNVPTSTIYHWLKAFRIKR